METNLFSDYVVGKLKARQQSIDQIKRSLLQIDSLDAFEQTKQSIFNFFFELQEELKQGVEAINKGDKGNSLARENQALKEKIEGLEEIIRKNQEGSFNVISPIPARVKNYRKESIAEMSEEVSERQLDDIPVTDEKRTTEEDKQSRAIRVSNILVKLYEDKAKMRSIRAQMGESIVSELSENRLSTDNLEKLEYLLSQGNTSRVNSKRGSYSNRKMSGSARSSFSRRKSQREDSLSRRDFNNHTSTHSKYFDNGLHTGRESYLKSFSPNKSVASASSKNSKEAKRRFRLSQKIEKDKEIDKKVNLFKTKSWGRTRDYFKGREEVARYYNNTVGKVTSTPGMSQERKKILI